MVKQRSLKKLQIYGRVRFNGQPMLFAFLLLKNLVSDLPLFLPLIEHVMS